MVNFLCFFFPKLMINKLLKKNNKKFFKKVYQKLSKLKIILIHEITYFTSYKLLFYLNQLPTFKEFKIG